jgi:hypothetical protein
MITYWVAYVGPGATTSAGEVTLDEPLTRAEQVISLQRDIARAVGMSHVVVTGWTVLDMGGVEAAPDHGSHD